MKKAKTIIGYILLAMVVLGYGMALTGPTEAHYAMRNEELKFFTEPIVISDLDFSQYWIWKDAPAYKNERIKYYQKLLKKEIANEDHIRNLVAQMIAENGAIDPLITGDNGCSMGIPQINTCVHHGVYAKTYISRHPELKDWKLQIEILAEWTIDRYKKYNGDIFKTVLAHNCPSCANNNQDNGYWEKVKKYTYEYLDRNYN